MTDSTKQKIRKRRFFRFSLRSFLIAVTLFGVVVGPYIYRAEKQKATVKWIEENGGLVTYACQFDVNGVHLDDARPYGPAWLHDILGIDCFSSVVGVEFYWDELSDLKPLAGLTKLSELYLANSRVTDLKPLARLTNLEVLNLNGTQVTNLKPLTDLVNLSHLGLAHK